jgi:hypothetical protein
MLSFENGLIVELFLGCYLFWASSDSISELAFSASMISSRFSSSAFDFLREMSF